MLAWGTESDDCGVTGGVAVPSSAEATGVSEDEAALLLAIAAAVRGLLGGGTFLIKKNAQGYYSLSFQSTIRPERDSH